MSMNPAIIVLLPSMIDHRALSERKNLDSENKIRYKVVQL